MLLALCLWLAFILTARVLRKITIRRIAELTGTEVEAKSVDLNLDGSVIIKELTIKPLLVDRQPEYNDVILKAETVYARFSITSLLLLRPRLKELTVSNFVFDVQYDLDTGRWNVSALKIKIPKDGSGKMPLVHLENGTLQYSKVASEQLKVIAAVPLDAEFAPDEEMQPGCIFTITTADRTTFGKNTLTGSWRPGLVTIAGGISSADVPAFERAWKINVLAAELKYDPNNYSLKLSIKDLLGIHTAAPYTLTQATPSFLEKPGLFTALQRFFNRFHPAGTIDIDLDASGNLRKLTESTLRGKIFCKDVSIIDQKFPYPVRHITGPVDFTENSVELNNLTGRHGKVSLVFDGWSKDFGPNWKYQIRITSNNMALDNDLYNALSTKRKKLWSDFSPTGIAAIDYRITRHSQTEKNKTLAVELLDADATYRRFPYPLKNLTGKLFFDSNSVVATEIVSKVNKRKIILNGKVTAIDTNRPIYDISVEAENIPLDSTLIDRLHAELKTKGLYRGTSKDHNDTYAVFAADILRIKGKSLTNLKADISYDLPRRSWLTENLIADFYGGRLTGKFELKQSDDGPWQYLLQTGFDNIDLKQFLSDPIHEPRVTSHESRFNGYTTGKMSGSLNVTGWIGQATGNNRSRTGRLRLQITDMNIGKLSPLAKLLYVLKLTEPQDFAFSRMLVDSYITDNTLSFEKLDLAGRAIAFNGSGSMDLQTRDIDLVLTARGQRLATAEPSVLQSLTEGLGQAVVRLEVTGNIYDPQVTTTTLPLIKETLKILGTKPNKQK